MQLKINFSPKLFFIVSKLSSPVQWETAIKFIFISFKSSIVVIVGCSHPGIMNILRTIEKRSGKKICGVVGGTHLMEADGERLRKTIDD